jgi:glyoxylate/hydroxypyruvate reductase A
MRTINILGIQRLGAADQARIAAVDPAIRFTDAGGWFDGEIRETWPAFAASRYLGRNANGSGTREERDRLLAEAEVIFGNFPFPLDLRARSPQLKWFHQRPAGASNLLRSDLWGSDVIVTTSRGMANPLPIAEYAVGAIFISPRVSIIPPSSERRAHSTIAPIGRCCLRARPFWSSAPAGSGVRSAGSVPRWACALPERAALQSRARRCLPASRRSAGAGDLDRLLPQSDFVVICCQWTPETTRLFNTDRFAAMKPGSVLVNVARGEIVDEEALADALARDHLRGAALDVYVGEFERAPMARLWSDPRVLITPHVSSNSDDDRHGGVDVFCENLRAYLDGQPLRNVIDWQRGY